MATLKILTINYLYIVNLSTGTVQISSNSANNTKIYFAAWMSILKNRLFPD